MLELLMFNKILDSAHYCGDTGLVISAKESGAVGSDDGVTQIVQHLREIRRAEEHFRLRV